MPLTKSGKKTLKAFKKEYGEKKGKKVFYAWENKNKGKGIVKKSKKKSKK